MFQVKSENIKNSQNSKNYTCAKIMWTMVPLHSTFCCTACLLCMLLVTSQHVLEIKVAQKEDQFNF